MAVELYRSVNPLSVISLTAYPGVVINLLYGGVSGTRFCAFVCTVDAVTGPRPISNVLEMLVVDSVTKAALLGGLIEHTLPAVGQSFLLQLAGVVDFVHGRAYQVLVSFPPDVIRLRENGVSLFVM